MKKLVISGLCMLLPLYGYSNQIVFSDHERNIANILLSEDVTVYFEGGISITGGVIGRINGIKASEFDKEYQANELRADKKFKGKKLLVKGKVNQIAKSAFGGMYLMLNGSDSFNNVSAEFKEYEEEKLLELDKGNIVDIYCIGSDMVLGSPSLRDCVFKDTAINEFIKEYQEKVDEAIKSGKKSDDKLVNYMLLGGKFASKYVVKDEKCSTKKCILDTLNKSKIDLKKAIKSDQELQKLQEYLGVEM